MKELTLTDENWETIQEVNSEWNRKIQYLSDMENFKKSDHWSFPKEVDGKFLDDCDGYAVAKKTVLKDSYGIDAYLALCWTETGGYHAVCMVHTDRGAYVLDNRFPMVFHYKDCGYKWHKIEMKDGSWQKFS